jgi:hypothetical protein
MRRWIVGALVLVIFVARAARAEWKAPADNKFSEDQLKVYLAVAAELSAEDAKLVAQAAASQSSAEKSKLSNELAKSHEDCLGRHHISREEYDWLSKQASIAWSVATYLDGTYSKIKSDFQATAKDNDAKLADAQARLAAYTAAQQAGRRVLSADDRQAAIKLARGEQQTALEEAKKHGDDADTAEADAKQHDDIAQRDDDLASNPPADVSDNDRPDYITTKKNEAQVEREVAKDVRSREAEAKKAQADALAVAKAAGQRADDPETPVTDEQRAAAKADNDAGIAQARHDIDGCNQAKEALAKAMVEIDKSATDLNQDAPPENVDLIRKYSDQYKQIFERAFGGNTTTRPGS